MISVHETVELWRICDVKNFSRIVILASVDINQALKIRVKVNVHGCSCAYGSACTCVYEFKCANVQMSAHTCTYQAKGLRMTDVSVFMHGYVWMRMCVSVGWGWRLGICVCMMEKCWIDMGAGWRLFEFHHSPHHCLNPSFPHFPKGTNSASCHLRVLEALLKYSTPREENVSPGLGQFWQTEYILIHDKVC